MVADNAVNGVHTRVLIKEAKNPSTSVHDDVLAVPPSSASTESVYYKRLLAPCLFVVPCSGTGQPFTDQSRRVLNDSHRLIYKYYQWIPPPRIQLTSICMFNYKVNYCTNYHVLPGHTVAVVVRLALATHHRRL